MLNVQLSNFDPKSKNIHLKNTVKNFHIFKQGSFISLLRLNTTAPVLFCLVFKLRLWNILSE